MRLIAFLVFFASTSFGFAQESKPPSATGDRDVNDVTVDPNETPAAKPAGNPAQAPSTAQPAQQPGIISAPAASVTAPSTHAEFSASSTPPTDSLPLPSADAARQTQLTNTLTFSWKQTPLEETIRVLARYLPKPVHLAVTHPVSVTAEYKDMPPTAILRQIADHTHLQLEESGFAYVLQDQGRVLKLETARVVFADKPVLPSASPLEPQSLLVKVPAAKDQKAADARYEKEHSRAAKKAKELSRPLDQ